MTRGRKTNTTKQPDEGRERHGEATESTEKATEKTTTKLPRQIVLAYMCETSCRFLHACFRGSVLTFVEVLLDRCLGALLRIEDGDVSQTLPLKVPHCQGERNICG